MKKIIGFFKWLVKVWSSRGNSSPQTNKSDVVSFEKLNGQNFEIDFVEDIPELMSDNTIFIVQDGNAPELLVFKCPCNCKAKIILNLLEDASPKWNFEIRDGTLIDIQPSIWRNVGCKSHFFVTNGKIRWV